MIIRITCQKITQYLKIIYGGGGNSLTTNKLQPKIYTQDIGGGLIAEIEQVPSSTFEDDNLVLGIPSESLQNGTKYGIIVYKDVDYDYIFDKKQEFTVGQPNPTLTLKTNQTYTLIVYSVGTDFLPVIKDIEEFYEAHFDVDVNNNTKIFHQIIKNFRVTSSGETLDIKLMNRISSFRVIIDTSNIFGIGGKEIAKIDNAEIKYDSIDDAYFRLCDDSVDGKHINRTTKLNFSKIGDGMKISSDVVNYFHYGYTGYFKANITLDFLDGHSIEKDFNIWFPTPSYVCKASLVIKLTMCCGATNGYRSSFMCYNLGVTDFRYSPFHPRPEIRGKLYTFSGKEVSPGTIHDKSENFVDPCPEGWKVPSADQWLRSFDFPIPIGDFKGNEYYSGVKDGPSNLVLPATGYLYYSSISGNRVRYHNSLTYNKKLYYWTSTPTYNFRYTCCGGDFNDIVTQDEYPMTGLPVRCIIDGWWLDR